MFLKSAFQNKIIINLLFFLFLCVGIFSLLATILIHKDDFLIPLFNRANANLNVNVEFSDKTKKEKFHFYMDDTEIAPYSLFDGNSYFVYSKKTSPVKYMYFTFDDNNLENINNIVINLGKNFYYYSKKDIEKFEKYNKNIYFLPSEIKYMKNSKFINDKGSHHSFFINVLSIFKNTNFYIFSVFCFFIAVLIYLNNKEKFNFNFEIFKKNALWLILLFGVFLRFSDINFPFWSDELYTVTTGANPNKPFMSTFIDPGNPPLFFILARFWMILFGNIEAVCRILPLIFSSAIIVMVYLFLKKNLNESAAIFVSFLASIDVYLIHSAQEFRSYSLCALLTVVCAYFLFEIIKNPSNKNFIFYAIVASLMANCHYLQILILFGNFLYAMAILKGKNRLKFFYSNLFAALMFLPYFVITALKQGLLDKSFNNLISYDIKGTWLMFCTYTVNLCVSVLIVILFIFFVVPKLKNIILEKNKKDDAVNLYIYSCFSVFSLYLTTYIFSMLIRPIVRPYYYVMIEPLILVLVVSLFYVKFKNKIIQYAVLAPFMLFYIFSFTGKGLYVYKEEYNLIRQEEAVKYAYYDSFNLKNQPFGLALVDFPLYNDFPSYYKNLYKENEEIMMYFFYDDLVTLYDKVKNSKSKIVYALLQPVRFFDFLEVAKKEGWIASVIETDKSVLVARIVKK